MSDTLREAFSGVYMKAKVELETTTNKTVYKRRYKELNAGCSRCPWHKCENVGRRPKHGVRKPKKTWK